MEAYERTAVADAFEERTYAAGEAIVTEGEQGDTFYMLCSGTAVATKHGPDGKKTVHEYHKEGDYFGELSLLNNRCSTAAVLPRRAHPSPSPSPSSGPKVGLSPPLPTASRHPARPRAASIEATGECTCVHLDRSSFERLLGPVIHILKRNAENYKSYADGQLIG